MAPPLRWKEHPLFPYTCKGCGTRHPKGDGVYLDQSGPRTVTYDNPLCVPQAVRATRLPKAQTLLPQTKLDLPVSIVPRADASEVRVGQPDQVSLTASHGGRSVELMVKVHGESIAKPTVDRLVSDVSRVVMEDISWQPRVGTHPSYPLLP